MAVFVYSDPHFYSESIIMNGKRPFKGVEEMNDALIRNYNSVVRKQDTTYWLGDVMWGATKEKVQNILRQMRGKKFLIMGNHDRTRKESWWHSCGFDRVSKHPVYDAENRILYSHEPLEEFGNNGQIANFHGHIHIQDYEFKEHQQCINVCVEKTNYRPIVPVNPYLVDRRRYSSH